MLTVDEKAVVREIARDESWVVAKAIEESNRIARALEESVAAIAATQNEHTAAITGLKTDVADLKTDVADLKTMMRAIVQHLKIEMPE